MLLRKIPRCRLFLIEVEHQSKILLTRRPANLWSGNFTTPTFNTQD